MDLFDYRRSDGEVSLNAPLADRMRPRNFDEFAGQEELVGEGRPLRKMVEEDRVPSMILWGPPGTGKTTLANIVARETGKHFTTLSAVTSGVKDVRKIVDAARNRLKMKGGKGTILFVDEIHRFNKAQQDAFLPHVESGVITLIGATTENPSFEVISALLSRCQVYVLEALGAEDLGRIADSTLSDEERGLGKLGIKIEDQAREVLVSMADGDARYVLNVLEIAASILDSKKRKDRLITPDVLKEATRRKMLTYDKAGDAHYDTISALHKSMRGSDPDASLYWLGRMLEAGDDPLYVARRIVRFASEDIGNSDPQALAVAMDAMGAVHFIGLPEGKLALAQAVIYMATAPKSNSVYRAYKKIERAVGEYGSLPVPLHIRNAPTGLMRDLGYGKDYKYAHNYEEGYAPQDYLPEQLKGTSFYEPGKFGFEKEIAKRMAYWDSLRKKASKSKGEESGD